jgi:hypothetical protein
MTQALESPAMVGFFSEEQSGNGAKWRLAENQLSWFFEYAG